LRRSIRQHFFLYAFSLGSVKIIANSC
jgi:hypothetical protein